MELTVKLEVFDGPLDLLLHLIEKNKVDIFDIPIVLITEQYLDYVSQMDTKDMDLMSEFLVMAATLIRIKSRMLLPREEKEEEEEEDPRQELVERLLEYKMYKFASFELKDRQLDADLVLFRKSTIPEEVREYEEPVDLDALLADVTVSRLGRIFRDVMKRQNNKIDPVRSKFGRIEKEEVPLPSKIAFVEGYAKHHRKFSFRQLLEGQKSTMHLVVTFLAILELMKTGAIRAIQENTFGEILIESTL